MSEGDPHRVVLHRRTPEEQIEYLILQMAMMVAEVGELKRTIQRMEASRKGGRPSKALLVKEAGVCSIDPDRDPADCPDASLYRRRQGCQGDACVKASSEYYRDRK